MAFTFEPVFELGDLDQLTQMCEKNAGKIIILDFAASWCGPCKAIAPVYKELADSYRNIVFSKVDVDEAEDITTKYDIKLMPTFIFLKNGEQIDILEGPIHSELRTVIEKYALSE